MSFTLRYHPGVRKVDLPLLEEKTKSKIRTAIEKRLQTAPQDYESSAKNLKGYWKRCGSAIAGSFIESPAPRSGYWASATDGMSA